MSAQDQKMRDMQKIETISDTCAREKLKPMVSCLWELIAAADELPLDDFRRKAQESEYELRNELQTAHVTDQLDLRVFQYLDGTYRIRLCQPSRLGAR